MTAARPDTWMPIYWGDYRADTAHLSMSEHGAYLLLIGHYWTTGKPLPDDDARLARIVCGTPREWKKARPALERFFQIGSGVWRHKRVEEELAAAQKNMDKRRAQTEAARRAKQAKTEECNNDSYNDCNRDSDKETRARVPPSPSPSSGSKEPSDISGRRQTSLDDLSADDELTALARSEGRDVDRELNRFRDYCRSKGKRYKDHKAAFRNWLRSDYGKRNDAPSEKPDPNSRETYEAIYRGEAAERGIPAGTWYDEWGPKPDWKPEEWPEMPGFLRRSAGGAHG